MVLQNFPAVLVDVHGQETWRAEMRVTLDLPDRIFDKIQKTADREEYGNRSAVIQKALDSFFAGKVGMKNIPTKESIHQQICDCAKRRGMSIIGLHERILKAWLCEKGRMDEKSVVVKTRMPSSAWGDRG